MARVRLALMLGIAVLAGCGDGPISPLAGTRYVLERIDGVAMPVSLHSAPAYTQVAVADTIHLGAFGRSRWVSYTRRILPMLDPPVDEMDRSELNWPYEVRDDSLFFRYVCRDVGDCLMTPWGTFSDDRSRLTVRVDRITYVGLREFRRIPD